MSSSGSVRGKATVRSPSPPQRKGTAPATVNACCCYLTALPSEDCDPDDSLVVTAEDSNGGNGNGAAVHINNPQRHQQDESATLHFPFTAVFPTAHKFSQSCYKKCVAPMVEAAAQGGSTMCVVGGRSSLLGDLHGYLLSNRTMQGLISQAAGDLLDSVNSLDDKFGAVTFSWFRIECGNPTSEVLCDVLKTASASQQQQQQQQHHSHAGSEASSGNNSSNSGLVLRDIGKGRGMGVPGLWEIEISSARDIEEVVDHVLKIIPAASDHSSGGAHTVMQLTVTNHRTAAAAVDATAATASGADGHPTTAASAVTAAASGGIADGPGVGRVSFVLLSNLVATVEAAAAGPGKSKSRAFADTDAAAITSYKVGSSYSWVEQTKLVTHWLESKRPSPPFHKTRVLLLLKDVLTQRQQASFLLLLRPSVDLQQENVRWLDLFARMCKDRMTGVNYVDFSARLPRHAISDASSHSRSASPATARFNSSNSRGDSLGVAAGGGGGNNGGRSTNSSSSTSRPTTPTNAQQQQRKRGSTSAASSSGGGYREDLDDSSRLSVSSRLGGLSLGSSSLHGMPLELKKDFVGYNIRTAASARSTSPVGVAKRLAQGPPSSPGALSTAAGVDVSVLRRFEETETALQMALEASRSESGALKIACDYSNNKYDELKAQYEELVLRLQEEGPFLVKRDRERLKNALKDLHGYEIYKEVMEAAMARMQHELEAANQENAEIKAQRSQDVKQARKQKNFSESYTKDLVITKRKLSEAEQKVQQLEKQLKQLLKEKETAVFALAQAKSAGSQKDGQKKAAYEAQQAEFQEMKAKLHRVESKCRALQCDKDAMLAAHAAESASLRTAQSKALEMLMNYQEENDVLRSAVGDVGTLKGVSFKRPLTSAAVNPQNNSALAAAGMLSRKPSAATTTAAGMAAASAASPTAGDMAVAGGSNSQ